MHVGLEIQLFGRELLELERDEMNERLKAKIISFLNAFGLGAIAVQVSDPKIIYTFAAWGGAGAICVEAYKSKTSNKLPDVTDAICRIMWGMLLNVIAGGPLMQFSGSAGGSIGEAIHLAPGTLKGLPQAGINAVVQTPIALFMRIYAVALAQNESTGHFKFEELWKKLWRFQGMHTAFILAVLFVLRGIGGIDWLLTFGAPFASLWSTAVQSLMHYKTLKK